MKQTIIKIFIPFLFTITINAQWKPSENIVSAKILFPVEQFARENSYPLLIELNIKKGWHINSNKPLEKFLIPTEINFTEINRITYGNIHFQNPILKKFSFSDSKVSVYEDRIYIYSSVTIMPDYHPDSLKITAFLTFQACDDQSCLVPEKIELNAVIPVVNPGNVIHSINQSLFNRIIPEFEESYEEEKSIVDNLRESGILYKLL